MEEDYEPTRQERSYVCLLCQQKYSPQSPTGDQLGQAELRQK